MDANKKLRRPDVLRKLNAENLQLIERGLLGDLPDRFKPQPPVPVRGQSTDLVAVKPHGLLSACLPVPVIDSPCSEKSFPNVDEDISPLKKTFSFREKISRISFFAKDRSLEKVKWKGVLEEERDKATKTTLPRVSETNENANKESNNTHKRFWFSKKKDLVEKREKTTRPLYTRSKSFEFLPRAATDTDLQRNVRKASLTKNQSYAFGSSDTIMDSWSSNESLEQLANVYYDKVDTVHLKSIRELPQDSDHNSSASTATSSGGLVVNIMKTESVQDLLDEFNKAVDMFSENYQSDCEPYTKSYNKLSVKEKRKSSSFSTLPSPKVVQMTKINRDDDFKAELSKLLDLRRANDCGKTARRGSVTDWFVLEENNADTDPEIVVNEANKYRRAQKKPMKRVRRMSSTKYVLFKHVLETKKVIKTLVYKGG